MLILWSQDAYEFSTLAKDNITLAEMTNEGPEGGGAVEYKPVRPRYNYHNPTLVASLLPHKPMYVVYALQMFHEWATVQPGMICVARKKKTAVFRQYIGMLICMYSNHEPIVLLTLLLRWYHF